MPKELIENSADSELVLELIQVLEREASLIETFLELLERQQKALVQNDLEELNRVTDLQRKKVAESAELSRRREKLIGEISEVCNERDDINITRLISLVSSGQADELSRIKDNILELNGKVAKVRTQNEALIEQSRENIRMTMEMLSRIKSPQSNYHNKGQTGGGDASLAMDRRA
jgi:hypothetical protein